MKPYSEACDQNRDPILNIIQPLFANAKNILEIGSGTGQHAVYFAEKMPHLIWHSSDQPQYINGIKMWIAESKLSNLPATLTLNVTQTEWPNLKVDAVFSANTTHIMHWHEVEALFSKITNVLNDKGLFVLYGPFNYQNQYTSESNARFDMWLKNRDSESGIRNFEDLDQLAQQAGLSLQQDYAMPANNRILCWKLNEH
jgi:cyclopropane fatty-acyl-phospholipid synthase-like methyltransferase